MRVTRQLKRLEARELAKRIRYMQENNLIKRPKKKFRLFKRLKALFSRKPQGVAV